MNNNSDAYAINNTIGKKYCARCCMKNNPPLPPTPAALTSTKGEEIQWQKEMLMLSSPLTSKMVGKLGKEKDEMELSTYHFLELVEKQEQIKLIIRS